MRAGAVFMCTLTTLTLLGVFVGPAAAQHNAGLKRHFYKKTCPAAEQIVQAVIWKHVANNSALPAKFLRMHFHDCFVRGCDASILLNSTANNTAEKNAFPNLSLAGFDVIEETKAAVEAACPGIVSCADILALAARDAVSFQFKKPMWVVKTGRRDGNVSKASEVVGNIPGPSFNFTSLVRSFANKRLSVKDLVVLSGGHTIGVGHCAVFSNRLYNFTGKGDADPSLNATYAAFLRTQCRGPSDTTTTVPMDPGSGASLDNHYYAALKQNQGLFLSDAALLTNARATKVVDEMLLASARFFAAFRRSMLRMGAIDVLTGTAGEIRNKCGVVNS